MSSSIDSSILNFDDKNEQWFPWNSIFILVSSSPLMVRDVWEVKLLPIVPLLTWRRTSSQLLGEYNRYLASVLGQGWYTNPPGYASHLCNILKVMAGNHTAQFSCIRSRDSFCLRKTVIEGRPSQIGGIPVTTYQIGNCSRFRGSSQVTCSKEFLKWNSRKLFVIFYTTPRNTLIGLNFATLNFAISRIFATFAKLKLTKICEIADSRNF